jgi:hypothetical protein
MYYKKVYVQNAQYKQVILKLKKLITPTYLPN